MSRALNWIMLCIGGFYMGGAVASWFGHVPPFSWGGTMVCAMAAVELAVLKLRGKVTNRTWLE